MNERIIEYETFARLSPSIKWIGMKKKARGDYVFHIVAASLLFYSQCRKKILVSPSIEL